MTAPTDRNRLDEEASPYLRQHADNPVNWQPWDDAALEAAREQDKPIFLSVGYSACHWCHVMEDESFQDDDVAALLNEQFVPIKVDREERPDVDSIYMTVCQTVTGRGGWPLSAWLTPEGKPFYVGTYFPKEPRRNMPGFEGLLERIAESWQDDEDRREMESRADQWTAAARDRLQDVPSAGADAPGDDLLVDAAGAIQRSADREHGGFGNQGPKFPQEARLHVLLRAHHDTGGESYADVARETLDAMADGGLYDHVGGGFHRYCTDRDWTVPHFEKMLYDNAELARLYLAGHQVFDDDDRYATVVEETFAFLERELRHPDGGLYATLDAQSETPDGDHEEGAFYVWTPERVADAVAASDDCDPVDADLFCERYGVTESGNFENDWTVLTISKPVAELAEPHDLDADAVRARLERARDAVFDARSERPRPRRDAKILAGWNGLAISALAEGAIVLEDDAYADLAGDALAFVREHLWDEDAQRLSRRAVPVDGDGSLDEHRDGSLDVQGEGYLEDYAFLARGAFDHYQATGDVESLSFARDLADVVHEEFYDADAGSVFFTPDSGEDLVVRPQEVRDQSTPSSLGVACDVLLSLSHFATDDRYEAVVETVLERHGSRIEASPVEHPSLALVGDRYRSGDAELTLACDDRPAEFRETLAATYLPRRVVAQRPATADGLAAWLDALELDAAPPIWADRDARDGPTAYACRSFACSPPAASLEDAIAFFD
ncbi:thioredoxin domain-containing protein [Halorubellus sp. JP-L1]|uniref:thioredoxin domain-containing protein n=1 Tax=Halorubellus sp. JP-L1 TaxID=2715753 RepID=UPI001407726A|nr:thioredoxin domain-containing protein [Halorubellus sp. JP-L1]NHN40286.1 thioredoxin domain-containing protein [Halorubellus sp. JP-L1]